MVSKVITFVIFAFLLAQNSTYSWSIMSQESVAIVLNNMYFYMNILDSNAKESADKTIVPSFFSLSTLTHLSGINIFIFLGSKLIHYLKDLILDFSFGVTKVSGESNGLLWQMFYFYIAMLSGWLVSSASRFIFNYVINAFYN